MPTRVFNLLDAFNDNFVLLDLADGVQDGPDGGVTAAISTVLSETGIGSFEFTINLSSTGTDENANSQCTVFDDPFFGVEPLSVEQTWEIDYTNFPAVPETARIKKLVFNRPRSVNLQYNANLLVNNNMTFLFYSDVLQTPIYFTPDSQSDFISPVAINEIINGIPADEVIFDHEGTPDFITRDELILNFSEFNNNLYGFNMTIAQTGDGIATPGECTLDGTVIIGLGWTVTVTWEEVFQWDIAPENTRTVGPGTEVTVISDPGNPDALLMDDIIAITVQPLDEDGNPIGAPIPVTVITVQTTNTLVFNLPDFPESSVSIEILITSTQFSGELALQTYRTIFITNAPGIYRLVPGQRYDVLYDRTDEMDVTTIQTKIPNPFIKTGFING